MAEGAGDCIGVAAVETGIVDIGVAADYSIAVVVGHKAGNSGCRRPQGISGLHSGDLLAGLLRH